MIIKLNSKIYKRGAFAGYWDVEPIYVNTEHIESIKPNENGVYICLMDSGDSYELSMTTNDLENAIYGEIKNNKVL